MRADPKIVEQVLKLRKQKLSTREIARRVGRSQAAVVRLLKQYGGTVPGAGAPSDPVGVPIDSREVDGETRIVTMDRPRTLAEMAELFGVNTKEWTAEYFRTNEWEGFYKVPGSHRKVKLWQTRVVWKRVVDKPVREAVLKFVKQVPAAVPRPRRPKTRDGFMVVWGLWDAHLGMYAWNKEVGESFDLSIATNRVLNSVDDIAAELELYPIERIVMPIGNDFMHFDSVRHTTTYGEHYLDTDTRYSKVFLEGLRCQCYMVERALDLADRVELLYVPGNHDTTSSFTMCAALQERFRREKRVSVDLSMNPRKAVLHGGTFVAFDHGRDVRPDQYQNLIWTEFQSMLAKSTYREVQVGDKHQRWEKQYEGVIPTNGLLVRRNPALCNVDAWHHKQGLIGEPMKSVEAWRYDRVGYRGSHVAWARDER